MVNDYDLNNIKNRFGALLSTLHDSGFTDEYITEAIIKKGYFDLFENDNLSEFNDKSLFRIMNEQFNKDAVMSFSSEYITDYIWAGEIFITMMINYSIPLKQLFIICPLDKMLAYFPTFHEMNNIKICDEILKLRKEVNIVKKLRNNINITKHQLSVLTDINEATLTSYEVSNDNLFKASLNNVIKLSKTLGVSLSCLKSQSNFIPFSGYLFSNKEFQTLFVNNLFLYFSVTDTTLKYVVVDSFIDEKEYKNLLNKNEVVVSLFLPFAGIIRKKSNKLKYEILSDNELKNIYQKTVNQFKEKVDGLVF